MDYTIVNGELYHSDELAHYGVKGMKWGVRKARHDSNILPTRKQRPPVDTVSTDGARKPAKRQRKISNGKTSAKIALTLIGTSTATAAVGAAGLYAAQKITAWIDKW